MTVQPDWCGPQPYDNHDGTSSSGHSHMISDIIGLDNELSADANTVSSVNGQTGEVALDASSVGADPAGTASGVQTASLQKAANLSDLTDKPASRNNLGLGDSATHPALDFVAQGLPAYAAGHTRTYDPFRNVYGGDTATRRPIRQVFAKGLANTTLVPIVFVGDSETISWKSNLGVNDQVTQFRKLLTAKGFPVTGGWIMPGAGFPDSTKDSRITTTGVWQGLNSTTSNYVWSTASGATLTWTFDLPGTIVEFAVTATTTHNVQYQIDGNAPVTISAVANVITPVQVTGLANTTHTLTITMLSTTITWLLAARCRSVTGVSISNMGIFGSKATDWAPGGALTISPYKMAFSALEPPALAFVGLGANDAGTATQAALEAAVEAVVNPAKAICPVVINGYPPLDDAIFAANGNSAYTTMAALATSEYNIADATGCMLIDHNYPMGTNAVLVAAGMAYSDQRHLLPPGYADVALRNVQALLGI